MIFYILHGIAWYTDHLLIGLSFISDIIFNDNPGNIGLPLRIRSPDNFSRSASRSQEEDTFYSKITINADNLYWAHVMVVNCSIVKSRCCIR